ncbi:MAG: Tol-Pal system beta propeller repeat protein TolB [Methylococcales bacterium]|nr:Tol-Pal system beta propeller repeat protein TolB [Methylococcales bacterium]
MKHLQLFGFIVLWGIYSPFIQAELNIDITKAFETKVPIAVSPFGSRTTLPENIAAIINDDLNRSGYFKTLAEQDMLTQPTSASQVLMRNWQILGQEYLLVGHIQPINKSYKILFQLLDVSKNEQIMDYKIIAKRKGLRRAAHQISDLVYEKLTGNKGVFGTKIAFVSSDNNLNKRSYRLHIADVDGYNTQTIVSSTEPIMSPAWSPDGNKIAYVSFENHRAAIFVQILTTGERIKVTSFPGINGAPAWSPDGNQLALTLSKAGSPNIYILNLASKQLTQLTHNTGINTEPTWSPDGRTLVFTSNQAGGKPQLYKIGYQGGKSTRLTFKGSYNASASFSPDGRSIAMVHANGENYKIAVMNLRTGSVKTLTSGSLDESPSFSSNGAMVLYATRQGGRGVLSAVSIDGRINQTLAFKNPEVREPAWDP